MTELDDTQVATAGRVRWPGLPTQWSYSSLWEAEECPRRWALSRALYPDLWERPGYPPKPAVAAVIGDVVHRALELVLHAMQARSIDEDPSGVSALRELGGYTALIRRSIDDRLGELKENPRMAPRLENIRWMLGQKVPDIRHRVQSVVARMNFVAAGESPHRLADRNRGGLAPGSYAEVDLQDTRLQFMGRADLISISDEGITITDYKTGSPDPRHIDQLRTYAVLWRYDADVNPNGKTATKLVIAYATQDVETEAPSATQLEKLRQALNDRIEAAKRDLTQRPPPARPSPETCRYCSVKHMCEDYWAALPNQLARSENESPVFIDCEGTVQRQNGPRSFVLECRLPSTEMLLRTPTESPPFTTGDHIRLVGVAYTEDDDAEQRVLTITQASEVFVISS